MSGYGLPRDASISYGAQGFPQWVYELCDRFGLKASTYPAHQSNQRGDIGAAPNPQGQNRGIDWVGTPDDMLRFAKWLRDTHPPGVEMVITQHPNTGEQVWFPVFVDFSGDMSGHRDHVHTRFSANPLEAQPLSKADGYAQAIIAEGQRRRISPRGIQIALATALVESNLRMYANASVPDSVHIPHDAVGSDHDSVGLFQQRCPMWGPADVLMNPALSAGLFYDRLVKLDYNGPNSPGSYAQAVQRSAFPGRYDERMGDAVALYNRLVTAQPIQVDGDDFMSALTPQEQRALYDEIMSRRASRSPLRHVGEGAVGDMHDILYNSDGSIHVMVVYLCAVILGDPDARALLREVAKVNTAQYPDRIHDSRLAQAMLNAIDNRVTSDSAAPTGQTPGVIPAVVPEPVGRHEAGTPVSISAEVQGVHHQLTDIAAELATVKHEIT